MPFHSLSSSLSPALMTTFSAISKNTHKGLSFQELHASRSKGKYQAQRHLPSLTTLISRLRTEVATVDLKIRVRNRLITLENPKSDFIIVSQKKQTPTGEIENSPETDSLPPNAKQILDHFSEDICFLTTSEIIKRTGIARQNVHRALKNLVADGHLEQQLQGKNSGYKWKQIPS
jgi:MarR family